MVQSARDLRDGDNEDQIEEELERRRLRGAARAASVPSSRHGVRRREWENGGRQNVTSLRVILSANRLPVYA